MHSQKKQSENGAVIASYSLWTLPANRWRDCVAGLTPPTNLVARLERVTASPQPDEAQLKAFRTTVTPEILSTPIL
ncbi:MAG: hypothetical protein ACKVU1_04490 [bacterium]